MNVALAHSREKMFRPFLQHVFRTVVAGDRTASQDLFADGHTASWVPASPRRIVPPWFRHCARTRVAPERVNRVGPKATVVERDLVGLAAALGTRIR